MRKFYFLLLGLVAAGMVMAQTAPTDVIIKNWDGSDLAPGEPLVIRPGETRALQFELIPAGADRDSVALGMSVMPEDSEPPYMPIIWDNNGLTVTGLREATRTLYVDNANDRSHCYTFIQIVCSAYDFLLYGAQCGDNVVCTLNENGELAFWKETVGTSMTQGDICALWDFASPGMQVGEGGNGTSGNQREAPWYQYADKIRTINTNNLTYIGSNAFRDIRRLGYLRISDDVSGFGESVFLGCESLETLEMRDTIVPAAASNALMIYPTGTQIPTIIVPAAAIEEYKKEAPWKNSTLVPDQGNAGDAHFVVGESDSISQGLALTIENINGGNIVLPDDGVFPWETYGGRIKDLHINDHISYIGSGAFATLDNVETVTFNQNEHPLDSIHIRAFSGDIRPRKFALGDPDGGPARPPKIIGIDGMTQDDALGLWSHFATNTVLLVPDVTVDGKKAVEWYKADPFWGQVFNRIDDRTVEVKTDQGAILLSWLPLEQAKAYEITITKKNCKSNCDTTIVIPAAGVEGLIDWLHMDQQIPSYIAARRAPKSDDGGGGMTLTISIKSGSGEAHNEEAQAKVEGLEAGEDYTFSRGVKTAEGMSIALTKGGEFKGPDKMPSAINDPVVNDRIVVIYDVLGRPVGRSLDTLSDGIYIIDNGTKRTTVLLRR